MSSCNFPTCYCTQAAFSLTHTPFLFSLFFVFYLNLIHFLSSSLPFVLCFFFSFFSLSPLLFPFLFSPFFSSCLLTYSLFLYHSLHFSSIHSPLSPSLLLSHSLVPHHFSLLPSQMDGDQCDYSDDPWVITAEQLDYYTHQFLSLQRDLSGFVLGERAERRAFISSGP